MALLLSQLTPAVDTGPIGFGINCLAYEVDDDGNFVDESSVFFISEEGIVVSGQLFLQPHNMFFVVN
jgi:hypothetical protein